MNPEITKSPREKMLYIAKYMPLLLQKLEEDEHVMTCESVKIVMEKYHQILLTAINVVPRVMFTQFEEDVFQSSPIHFRLIKNKGYWSFTHDNLRDDDKTQSYKAHYRMKKATFNQLIEILDQHSAFDLKAHNSTPTYMQVAVVLWRFSNCHFGYRMMEATLGFGQGSLFNFTERFLEAVNDQLGHLISWPSTEDEFRKVKHGFEFPYPDDLSIKRLPNVIGAVDGKLIVIHRPKETSESYRDRKSNLSVNLTAVVTSECKFSYVYAGESGRCHDAHVFSESDIAKEMLLNPERYFFEDAYILGDSAYPLSYHVITPYSQLESDLDPNKARFNAKFSAMRQVVERAFGILVKRWRFLWKYVYIQDQLRLVKIVNTSCILHNFCINANDTFGITDEELVELSLASGSDRPATFETNTPLERTAGGQRRDLLNVYVNTFLN